MAIIEKKWLEKYKKIGKKVRSNNLFIGIKRLVLTHNHIVKFSIFKNFFINLAIAFSNYKTFFNSFFSYLITFF